MNIIRVLVRFFNLREGEDTKEKVLENITSQITFIHKNNLSSDERNKLREWLEFKLSSPHLQIIQE